MALQLYIDTVSNAVQASLIDSPAGSPIPINMPDLVVGDVLDIELYFTAGANFAQWSGDLDYIVRLGIGIPGALPDGGQWSISDGSDETALLDHDASAVEVANVLNALNGGAGAQGEEVHVTKAHAGYYTVLWLGNGLRQPLTADASALTPDSSIAVTAFVAGDASTRARQVLRMFRAPVAYNATWSIITDPTTSVPVGFAGSLSLNNTRVMELLNGQTLVNAYAEIEVSAPSGARVTRMQVPCRVLNQIIDEAALDAPESVADTGRFVRNASALNALTGGGPGALDGVQTARLATGTLMAVEATGGTVSFYRLIEGSDSTFLPRFVQPLDFDAANPRVWMLLYAHARTPTSLLDLGTLNGSGTTLIGVPSGTHVRSYRVRVQGDAPFDRVFEVDSNTGEVGDLLLLRVESLVSGNGYADVRVRHSGPSPVYAGLRFHAGSSGHGWIAMVRTDATSQGWRLLGSGQSADYFSDPVFPLSPSIPQEWRARLSTRAVGLADAPQLVTDALLSNVFTITLTGDRTLANPLNMAEGQTLLWVLRQDGSGGRSVLFGDAFRFPGGTPPTLSTAPDAVDVLAGVISGGAILCNLQRDFR